jgi:flagellar motor switch protein FliM
MAEDSVLSEEELDALRATGDGDGGDDPAQDTSEPGGQRTYDFRDPSRVLNGRLPGLEAVHDAFVGGMRKVFRMLLGRVVEIETGETSLTRLGDYQHSMPLPVSVHAAAIQGREQPMFLVAEGGFVYACVDAYFGGKGSGAPALERELSASERRLTSLLAGHVFDELKNAWAPLCALNFSEPRACQAAGMGGLREDQIMVVSRFQVDLQPGAGDFHLSMPYGLLDGLRPYLSAGPRAEETSHQWRARFVEKVFSAEVEARAAFPGVQLSFSDLMSFAPGDFIPINRRNEVSVIVGERVLYMAEPGTSNGQAAAKVIARGARDH